MRLMHCPFCGEEERIRLAQAYKAGPGVRWIQCDSCESRGPEAESTQDYIAQETATNSWNNRLPHAEDLALRVAFKMT